MKTIIIFFALLLSLCTADGVDIEGTDKNVCSTIVSGMTDIPVCLIRVKNHLEQFPLEFKEIPCSQELTPKCRTKVREEKAYTSPLPKDSGNSNKWFK